MLFEKKWISYIIWIAAMVGITIMAVQCACLMGIEYVVLPIKTTEWIWMVVFLVVVIALYFIGNKLTQLISSGSHMSKETCRVFKAVLTVILFLGGIGYRVYLLYTMGGTGLKDTSYFDIASKLLGDCSTSYSLAAHGASFAYIQLLGFFMKFLGTRTFTVFVLQTIIQILTLFLVYGFARRMLGWGSGFFAVLILGFSPLYTDKIFVALPGCFLTMITFLGMYLLIILNDTKTNGGRVFFSILSGLVTGLDIYLDAWTGILLIVLLFVFIHSMKNKEERKIAVLSLIITILCAALGYILCLCIDGSFITGKVIVAAKTWFDVNYNVPWPLYIVYDYGLNLESKIIIVCMFGLSIMTCLAFVRKKQSDHELIWLLMLIAAPTPLTCVGFLQDSTMAFVLYAILAASGLMAILTIPSSEEKADYDCSESGKKLDNVETVEDDDTTEEENNVSVENIEIIKIDSIPEKKPVYEMQVDDLPGMIPNPLPLPPKKAHTGIEFDNEGSADDDFDVDISDDDDFDI